MKLDKVAAGNNPPKDINVIIEVSQNSLPVKYEVDLDNECLFIDRFVPTPMFYPANYGFIPNTKGGDGDALDCLVLTPYPVLPLSVVRSRPIGVLMMEDEGGMDEKILAVPHDKLTNAYDKITDYSDLETVILDRINHFFTHYKDLEKNKWVKVKDWMGLDLAYKIIADSLLAS